MITEADLDKIDRARKLGCAIPVLSEFPPEHWREVAEKFLEEAEENLKRNIMSKQVNYHILHVMGETWFVPENFAFMKDLKKAVQKINDKELSLSPKESEALQTVTDANVCPNLIRIKR